MLTQEKRFRVIPAVDVLEAEVVRLERGDFSRITSRRADPLVFVEQLVKAGAALIHLVDLGAARSGKIRPELVRQVVAAAGVVPVQAAGGVRSLVDAERVLEAGAARVVVGTAVFVDDRAVERYAVALGDRLVVAIDVRDGVVAVRGWEDTTSLRAEEAAERCREAGAQRLLCTAIERDGTLTGPDVDLLGRVRAHSGIPVLAAGGIRSLDDLAAVEAAGCEGGIVGRALLDGVLPLSVLAHGPASGTR
ncbi:MAG TPA: 1-(5-phosphoribosyl)-5-[(5-phosphoribosylamino)methylideneamino] imidazole-4-carboxamide isomerase [Gaiellaceae bacterium]|nr:1-(5-phosphoribosyl)-5-[(5-phosphoribosylamino)methylideneamino] imidazole-4-carboxamide isomerase [Gaiellaceae bacterium]